MQYKRYLLIAGLGVRDGAKKAEFRLGSANTSCLRKKKNCVLPVFYPCFTRVLPVFMNAQKVFSKPGFIPVSSLTFGVGRVCHSGT